MGLDEDVITAMLSWMMVVVVVVVVVMIMMMYNRHLFIKRTQVA